jgi:hypothetical protein
VRVSEPASGGYIFGASVFLENPKSMSEGPLFLGWFVKFLFHFAFLGAGGEPDVTWVRVGLGDCG